ncbi:uncharacterized protein E0L32_008105 [Thyridium curvatum]|uniref:Cytokinin riboside 5'-monophosphate phosphoribohydrolase n=1 Tax=Thyridium curvatum TaxID=1093900 RepID=A0A507B0V1_9PEZI|nr:uncharacterized protein E0L32_008105 [Thyridium curvatum]TPX10899.1 hypothetical protein E0L32_008105 [Thyridium curvatum]
MESGGASPIPTLPASRNSTPASSNLNPNAVPRTKICVFCGSSPGHNPAHVQTARQLAKVMADNNIALVYGGGTVGLMGEVAKTLVALSGPDAVHGIIPEALVRYERDPEFTSTSASATCPKDSNGDGAVLAVPEERMYGRTTVVRDMHSRKQMMAQEVLAGGPGSGFVALSGGYGTMEELLEIVTWNQLGIHNRGIVVLNVAGFYDGVLNWIRQSVREGFIRAGNADILVEATTAEDAVQALRDYKVPTSVLKLAWGKE